MVACSAVLGFDANVHNIISMVGDAVAVQRHASFPLSQQRWVTPRHTHFHFHVWCLENTAAGTLLPQCGRDEAPHRCSL